MKRRRLAGPLLPLVRRLNEIRRAYPALQRFENLRWLETQSEQLIAYAKTEGPDVVLVVVNLDTGAERDGLCIVPGARPASSFPVKDLLGDATYRWRSGRNFVRLPPGGAHLMHAEVAA